MRKVRTFLLLSELAFVIVGCGPMDSPNPSTGSGQGTSSGGGGASSSSSASGGGGTTGAAGTASASSSTGSTMTAAATTGSGGTSSTGSTGGAGGSGGTTGNVGSGGAAAGGKGGTDGSGGKGGSLGGSGAGGASPLDGGADGSGGSGGTGPGDAGPLARFSFFVTSLKAMRRLSGSNSGFGGDLRFGKADGLSGADEICRQIAETSMPGSGQKQWRAFLSVTRGPNGTPVNAIDRVGNGPWYDRRARLVAMTKADLAQPRPRGADPTILNDLPNEDGVPNHNPDGTGQVDNHDVLTGTNSMGNVIGTNWGATCHDWTSAVGSDGKPHCGHSWPRQGSGVDWMSSLDEAGCAPGVNIVEMGPPNPNMPTVGSGGGYGAIYCLALSP